MSYPSIHRHLEAQGTTVDTASDDQMRQAFIGAFHTDLPLGYAKVTELVEKDARPGGSRHADARSELRGRQAVRPPDGA